MFNEIVVANKNYASVTVDRPESLDQTAIRVIRYDCPSFLLPIRLVNIDNMLQLRYEIQGGIRLAYMPQKMRKREMNRLLYHMVEPYMKCADWFLDYRNIYLDRSYIMVDQNDYKVKYIYLPMNEFASNTMNSDEDILKFFSELIASVDIEDDPAYMASLVRCVIGREASLGALLDMLKNNGIETAEQSKPFDVDSEQSVKERKVSPEIPKETLPVVGPKYDDNNLAGTIGSKLFDYESGAKKKNDKENRKENKKESKLEKGRKSKGLFGKLLDKEGDKKEHVDDNGQGEAFDSNVYKTGQIPVQKKYQTPEQEYNTEIADEDVAENIDTLRMRLESSSVDKVPGLMELDMSKGYVIVGRYDKTGKMSADFNFDMSLTFIGRRHARFEKTEEAFFVIDLDSKNHTYLNNEELLPNRRYQIHSGDHITFTKKYGITYQVC
ncbi:MAG: FHA domain-containing protein [Lachnospiraceae bacterium]|nr:FHA domain-containing protein [Lachnospiraceae bacterium]